LWAIPAGGKPISLGLLPVSGNGRIQLSKEHQALLTAPLTLAVSLEPQGGSPTGQPTGPVLYQGQLASL
ncbi:MAG: anti-sigma factor, partial [Pseudomonas sp.]|nr:anti-sigma factor [Pseudomonas sp.]